MRWIIAAVCCLFSCVLFAFVRVEYWGFTLVLNFQTGNIGEGVAGKGKRGKWAGLSGLKEIES